MPSSPPIPNTRPAERIQSMVSVKGGVVISLGINTYEYRRLVEIEPSINDVLVDVRDYVHAPPRNKRASGVYPHPGIVEQVRGSRGYESCVSACSRVLLSRGIVVIGCKGGRHRAPTVASEFHADDRHVIHLTVNSTCCAVVDGCKCHVTLEDVAVLLRSCLCEWDSSHIIDGIHGYTGRGLCIGWSCKEWAPDTETRMLPVDFGQRVDIVATQDVLKTTGVKKTDSYDVSRTDGVCYVFFHDTCETRLVATSFLLPVTVCALHSSWKSQGLGRLPINRCEGIASGKVDALDVDVRT